MIKVQKCTVGQGECLLKSAKISCWVPESTAKWSVGMGRRHPVSMRKTSFKALPIRRVWALRHQTSAQYSAVETRDKAAVRSVSASAPYRKGTSHLSSVTCKDSFLPNATRR